MHFSLNLNHINTPDLKCSMVLETLGVQIAAPFYALLNAELALTIWFNSLPSYVHVVARILSQSVFVLAALIIYLGWKYHSPRRGAYFFLMFAVSYLLSTFLKVVFNVPAPDLQNSVGVYDSAFPSRHSMVAFTGVALAVDKSVRKFMHSRWFGIWALLILLSRLVLGVHYLHDLVAGAIFGYLLGQVMMHAKKQFKKKFFDMRHYPRKFVMKPGYKLEFERKLFHVFGGTTIALLALFLPEILHVPLLLTAIAATGLLSYAFKNNKKVPSFLNAAFGRIERKHDAEKFPLKGILTMLIGILPVAIFFDAKITAAAALVLGLGDGFSTMMGILFGVSSLFYNDVKAWEGVFVGIVIAFFGLSFLYPPTIAIFAATIPMLLESMDMKFGKYSVDDNLLIPPATAIVLWLMTVA